MTMLIQPLDARCAPGEHRVDHPLTQRGNVRGQGDESTLKSKGSAFMFPPASYDMSGCSGLWCTSIPQKRYDALKAWALGRVRGPAILHELQVGARAPERAAWQGHQILGQLWPLLLVNHQDHHLQQSHPKF